MARDLEPWGGDVRMPRWMRRVLRRPEGPGDTPERARERHRGDGTNRSVAEAADRAAVGPLSELYREGRPKRRSD
jgi:hypothetical protein